MLPGNLDVRVSGVDDDLGRADFDDRALHVAHSDGLTDPLEDREIEMLCGRTHPEDLADTLVQEALRRGGDDNVTVVVVVVGED